MTKGAFPGTPPFTARVTMAAVYKPVVVLLLLEVVFVVGAEQIDDCPSGKQLVIPYTEHGKS